MLSNNVPTTSSVEQNDFLHFSVRSGLNFNASRRPYYFIKRLVHIVYKKISGANVY